jgi:hypothetical protein
MLRANNQTRLFQKRTIRPLYGWHSAVPYACFLDTSSSSTTVIYPGQVAVKTTGEQMDYSRAVDTMYRSAYSTTSSTATWTTLVEEQKLVYGLVDRDSVFEILAGPSSTETPLDSTQLTWTTLNATRGGVRTLR